MSKITTWDIQQFKYDNKTATLRAEASSLKIPPGQYPPMYFRVHNFKTNVTVTFAWRRNEFNMKDDWLYSVYSGYAGNIEDSYKEITVEIFND